MYLYDPKAFDEYRERWVAAVDSSIKYIASHPSTREDLTFVADYNGPNVIYRSGHRRPLPTHSDHCYGERTLKG